MIYQMFDICSAFRYRHFAARACSIPKQWLGESSEEREREQILTPLPYNLRLYPRSCAMIAPSEWKIDVLETGEFCEICSKFLVSSPNLAPGIF